MSHLSISAQLYTPFFASTICQPKLVNRYVYVCACVCPCIHKHVYCGMYICTHICINMCNVCINLRMYACMLA